jgi:hypothetical protein
LGNRINIAAGVVQLGGWKGQALFYVVH